MSDTTRLTVGDLLRRYRLAAGLTQQELAKRSAVSSRAISDLERGNGRIPRAQTLARLAEALGLSPDETRELRAAVRRSEDRMVGRAPVDPSSHPPVPLTPLRGREREMAEGIALLRCDDLRLLTLTGLGGVGKTRLAIDLAHALETAYTHGATFVSLAALSNPELLPDTLLHTLGLQESSGRPSLESVKLALRAQQRLLVLDNFEQILPAAATVVDLLESCPQLTVLVTSRAPLHVRGEHLVIVPPLELDDAVVLFTERARALQANLVLTPADEAVVVDICRRLDGLPLAIELAAARGQELTPTALLAHLDRRLGLLTRGPRDLPSRQRTLRTTLEWSHELLPPGAQRLFRRLAVFRGGFTLAAAGAVDQCPGTEEVLALLGELVDYSLVQRRGERFAMLETVREFAWERLAESGEEDEIQMRMLDYFLALAEVADAAVTRTGWDIAALETDLDNLRTALNWALRLQPEAALQFAGALGFLWYFQGYYQEGIRWLEAVLAVTPKSPVLEARARSRLAAVLMEVGNRTQARRAAELSLTLYQAIGDRAGEALQLNAAGLIDAMESALNRAAEEFEISLRLFQEAGHAAGVALVLANLGWVSVLRRDRRRAAATLEESLALARTGGDRGYLGWALVNQGRLDLEMGRLDRARDSFIEALELDAVAVAQLSVPPRIVVSALQGLAAVAATEHDAIGAAQVLGTAEAICDATGFVAWPAEQAFHQRYLAAARAQLSDAEWSTALETGRALGIRETLADAQARHNSPPKSPKYGLSARELEVLRLVAEGLTDAAVGSRLFISPRTVSQHLRSIYNKLGVHSRLAATRLAVEQHLV